MSWTEPVKGSCDANLPDCLSPSIRDPWETDYAAVMPRFSGSLSAISSAAIIYVILRSEKGLSGIYHRIMFGMSTADILGSLAMALTSLPMPSYMFKEEEFGYHWAGTRLGNTYTCNAQGFFATFGASTTFAYNATLCIFYTCSIAFNMRQRNIRKYVEPIIHGLPILVGLTYAVPPLILDMYNPGNTSYAWCAPLPYPDECAYQDVDCVRGSPKAMHFLMTLLRCLMFSDFSIILVSLVLVIWKVTSTERLLRELTRVLTKKMKHHSGLAAVVSRHNFTKSVALQGLAYILALLLSLLPPLLRAMNVISGEDESSRDKIAKVDKAILFLLPLQGFYNFIIFISHKICNYRRINNSISICGILRLLFLQRGTHEPVYISRISIVKREQADDDDDFCNDYSGKDCWEIPQTFPKGGGHHRDFYEVDVADDDDENDEAEALRFRISLFQQNQLQEVQDGSIQCEIQKDFYSKPSGTFDSTLDFDPIEQLDTNSTNLSGLLSISSLDNIDGEGDISYEDLSYPSGHMSNISNDETHEDPKRKYYESVC
jgi:hypothetical protein